MRYFGIECQNITLVGFPQGLLQELMFSGESVVVVSTR